MSHYLTIKGIGSPIAYFPKLAVYLESVTAAVFLGQMIYWHDKAISDLGVYKTSDEITQETGLTYREQSTARKKLSSLGLVTETNKRLEHRIYFKFHPDVFDEWLDGFILREIPERRKRNSGDDESAIRETTKAQFVIHKNTTEITSEITTYINNIFSFWKSTFNKGDRTKLEGKRERVIKARLNEGYSVDEIKTAIINVSKSQWHIDNGQTDIELICRNQINLDKYLALKPQQQFNQQPNSTFNRLGELADEWDRKNANYTPY